MPNLAISARAWRGDRGAVEHGRRGRAADGGGSPWRDCRRRSPAAPCRQRRDPRGYRRGRRRDAHRRRRAVTSRAAIATVPRSGCAQADQRLDQLGLAVAGDAGDADDLAGTDGQADAVDERPAAIGAATVRSRASSSGAPGVAGGFSTLQVDARPVMARTISRVGGVARSPCARRPCRRAAR